MKELPPASEPLGVSAHRDATIMPLTPHEHPLREGTYDSGVFNRRGNVVRQSLLFRSYGRFGFPAEFKPTWRYDPRSVIFGGHLTDLFGHFVLEGLSRLWFAKDHPDLPIAWVGWASEPPQPYLGWQRELLEMLGIRNEAVFLNEPTRFRSVHVPQPGYRIQDWFSDQFVDFLAVYPARPRDPRLKVWLSRAELHPGLGSVFAYRLDRHVAEAGWTVVRPEGLLIREQLELLATASRVAGEEGSAFHHLALLSDVSGLEVDIIGRRPERSVDEQNQNYATVARARGLRQRFHVIPQERTLFAYDRFVRKVTTTLSGHLEVAGVERNSEDVPGSPGAARELAGRVVATISAESWLEVAADPGAFQPEPALPVRDIVRPAFTTDPRVHGGEGQQLYEMPPDEFFDYCADLGRRYDVIYIDAPEAPAELWRWFVASRRHAHDGTIWVLRGADQQVAADLGGLFRATTVTTTDGPCLLVLGPAADAAVLELA